MAQPDLPKSKHSSPSPRTHRAPAQPHSLRCQNTSHRLPITLKVRPVTLSSRVTNPGHRGTQRQTQRNTEDRVSRQPCKSTLSLHSYQGSGNSPTIHLEFLSTTVPKQAFLFSDFLGDIPFYDYTHI